MENYYYDLKCLRCGDLTNWQKEKIDGLFEWSQFVDSKHGKTRPVDCLKCKKITSQQYVGFENKTVET